MLVVDENVSEIEVWRLRERGIAVRQIGPDVASASLGDDNVLPLLHRMKRPTFFTRDRDFWRPRLRHRAYCLVFVDVVEQEGQVAAAIRRFLRHSDFRHFAQRAGKIVRLHADGIGYWTVGRSRLHTVPWTQPD